MSQSGRIITQSAIPGVNRLDTLRIHCVCDLEETGDIRARLKVAFQAIFLGGVGNIVIDANHDLLELRVHFSKAEVATPPALAALAGPKSTPAAWKASIAAMTLGMFAPSATQ